MLDLGCGTEDDSRAIAGLVGAIGQVVAIDFSATMIAEAQRSCYDFGSCPIQNNHVLLQSGLLDVRKPSRSLMRRTNYARAATLQRAIAKELKSWARFTERWPERRT